MSESNNKICIVAISLAKGGLERAISLLTKMLKTEGFEIHLVLLNDEIDYEFEGILFNLGKDKSELEGIFARLKRFKRLKNYIQNQKFKYIIDARTRPLPFRELYYLNYV